MMRNPIPITPEGLQKVKAELQRLKTVEKPQNIQDIEVARGHGDLSENAEYHAAKERQSHLAGRIAELEEITTRAQVINPSDLDHQKIYFGATVTLVDTDTEQKQTYQIVGVHESDVKRGKISVESPLAKRLIGREEGDVVKLMRKSGEVEYEIEGVDYK